MKNLIYCGDLQNLTSSRVLNLHPLGAAFQRLCRSKPVYSLLPDYGFMDGGCLSLALAVKRVLGSAAQVCFVVAGGITQHAVVRLVLNGEVCYLDADGLASADDLLTKMRLVERVRIPAHLAVVTEAEAAKAGITDGAGYSRALAPRLARLLKTFPVEIPDLVWCSLFPDPMYAETLKTPAQFALAAIWRLTETLYGIHGQSATLELGLAMGLPLAYCPPCECETPSLGGSCLTCGCTLVGHEI